MNTPTLLSRVSLQHQALTDPGHKLLAVRLGWAGLPGQADTPLAALLPVLADNVMAMPGLLMLPVNDLSDLQALATGHRTAGLWLDVAPDLAAQAEAAEMLQALRGEGLRLVSRAPVAAGSPPAVPMDLALDATGRAANGSQLGWPVNGPPVAVKLGQGEAHLQLMVEVIQRIDRDDEVDSVVTLLDNSPTLSFRLLQYLNSAASGLRNEVSSVRHAIMMLGYRRLRQWMALLMTSAVETPQTRPLMQASVRRAFLLQELSACLGNADGHGDLFICGVFSLLDQMLGKPMAELLRNLPLPEDVALCLGARSGPLRPYLDLACQLEAAAPFDLLAACEATATTPAEVNTALLVSLQKAGELAW